MPRSLAPALILLVAWLAPAAAPQAVTLLQPASYEVAGGQALRVHLTEERAGAWADAPWPADDVEWLFLRAAGAQRNLHEVLSDAENGEAVTLPTVAPGVTVVGLERRARSVTVAGAELREFLAQRVAPAALPEDWREQVPETSVRVRRIESSKLLVRVLDDAPGLPPSSTAQSKTGQRAEIRLLADPTRVPLRHDLPLRVYLPRTRPDSTRVIARHAGTGRTQSFFTDPGGTGFFTLTGPGVWTVEVHGARPVPEETAVDWELVTATLSFQVPARDDRRGAGR